MKLKLRLYRDGCEVFGWVEKQDEELTQRGIGSIKKLASLPANAVIWHLDSCGAPELQASALYVRGSNPQENKRPFVRVFDAPTQAQQACEDIMRLVAKVNEPEQDQPAGQVTRYL